MTVINDEEEEKGEDGRRRERRRLVVPDSKKCPRPSSDFLDLLSILGILVLNRMSVRLLSSIV